jgi:hypothetical protein
LLCDFHENFKSGQQYRKNNEERKGEKLTIGPGLTIRGAEVQFGQGAVEAEPMEGPRMLSTLLKYSIKCNMRALRKESRSGTYMTISQKKLC